jgi:outer membrane protein
MKSLFKTLTLVSVMTFGLNLYAQKFAYVDVEYILNSLPEYKSAQAELDKISVQWQKEIESKIAEVDKLYKK